MTSGGASIAMDKIKRESQDRPRNLEDIRNTLQALSERRMILKMAKNVHDREELSKCNAILKQMFRTFQVIRALDI
jgi:hypothetical protein